MIQLNEKIVLIGRTHGIALLPILVITMTLCSICAIAMIPLFYLPEDIEEFSKSIYFALSFGMLLIIHWFFFKALTWQFSRVIITEKKVIIFHNFPFLQDQTMFINITEIDEIEHNKEGFISNIFNFGDIRIHLPASPTGIILKRMGNPSHLVQTIEDIKTHQSKEEE